MPKYAAFLRGVNLGKRRLKMDLLRQLFSELDLLHVKTVLASGNVTFSSSKRSAAGLEKLVEAHLHEKLGYEVATFIRQERELQAIVSGEPFSDFLNQPGYGVQAVLFKQDLDRQQRQELTAAITPPECLVFDGRQLYALYQGNLLDSGLSSTQLWKRLPCNTQRNWNTMRRVLRACQHAS